MTGRWPAADEETRDAILKAKKTRDQAVAAADGRLLDLINDEVTNGRITIAAAAGVVGQSRAPLSRALNARGATGRPGGGRSGPPTAETRRALLAASETRDEAVKLAEAQFAAALATAVDEQRVTVIRAAEILGVHRNTLATAIARHRAEQQ